MLINLSTKKLLLIRRFFIQPISLKTLNPNSPPISSSFSSSIINQNVASHTPNPPRYVSPKLVSQVIDVVRSSTNGDCRRQLNLMDTRLSKVSICEIIRVLSCQKVPALQFFHWIRDNNPDLHRNSDVCSLMIDNCGWLNDFNTMRDLLKRFKHHQICLNEKAFGFLPVLDSTKSHAMESVSLVVRLLGEIGGSVRSSGVYALIGMLSAADCFDLAKYVIEITEKKASYYAILVREKCRRRRTEEAHGLIRHMRAEGCEPEARMYNYVLGSLCKTDKMSDALGLFEEMKESGVDPDEITFEILIWHACRVGRMEVVKESFERLVETGREPRVLTCAAIVRGYFNAGRYEEAYEYVREIEGKRMPQVHKVFSLLARLHLHRRNGNGDGDGAARILGEMMEKGLKPDYLSYAKTLKFLRLSGDKDVACELKKKYSKFRVE